MTRTLDPDVDEAIGSTALMLLMDCGFARMSIEAVGEAAGVGLHIKTATPARVFAGLDTGPRWRKAAFETWWDILGERQTR